MHKSWTTSLRLSNEFLEVPFIAVCSSISNLELKMLFQTTKIKIECINTFIDYFHNIKVTEYNFIEKIKSTTK
jgi:hypothetical protein